MGQPDLSGVWSNATTTPVERRAEHKALALTEEEAGKVQGAAESYRRAGDATHDRQASARRPTRTPISAITGSGPIPARR